MGKTGEITDPLFDYPVLGPAFGDTQDICGDRSG